MGQTNVQKYMPWFLEKIGDGKLQPDATIPHHLPLTDAARGYDIFNMKQEDCRKIVLTPDGP